MRPPEDAAGAGAGAGAGADVDAARPPWIAGVSRLPTALLAPGLLIHLGVAVGALLPGTLAAACALAGLALGGPLAAAATERAGERAVLLVQALIHVPVLLVMLPVVDRLAAAHSAAGADVGEQPAGLLLLGGALALLAGVSCPAVSTAARLRRGRERSAGGAAHASEEADARLEAGLHREMRRDEGAMVLAPVLLGVLAPMIGSSAGLLAGALVSALVVPLQAMDPRAASASCDADDVAAGDAGDVDGEVDGGLDGMREARIDAMIDPQRPPLPGLAQAQQLGRPRDPSDQTSAGDWAARLPRALVWAVGIGGVLGGLWAGLLAGSGVVGPRPGAAWGLAVSAVAAVLATRRPPRRIVRLSAVHRRRLAAVLLLLGLGVLVLVQLAATVLASAAPRLLAVGHGPAQLVAAAVIGAAAGLLIVELHRTLAAVVPARLLTGATTLVPAALLAGMSSGLLVGGLLGDLFDAGAPAWVPAASVVAVVPAGLLAVGAALRR